MAMQKGDIEIGYRMVEELERVFGSKANAVRQMPCRWNALDSWKDGTTPSGHMLAKLHYHGGDVIYVLTGKRGRKDG